jgi:hypothetical protein
MTAAIVSNESDAEIIKRKDYFIRKTMRDWFLWQVVVPVGILAAFLPCVLAMVGAHAPWAKPLGEGDLLLFGGVLTVGMSVELRRVKDAEDILRYASYVDRDSSLSLMMALFIFLTFAAVRVDVTSHRYFEEAALCNRAIAYVCTSIVATVASVAFSWRSYWKALSQLLRVA